MTTNRNLMTLVGAGAGAALLYFLDPDRGARRRALVRDRAVSLLEDTQEGLGKVARDARNRAQGLGAKANALVHDPEPVDDETLVERVRSRMGRFTSHPRAITVDAMNGVVEIEGPILSHERRNVVRAIRNVPGVEDVVDRLESYDESDRHPSLQGGKPAPGAPFELAQRNWSPAPRFLVGALGSALVAYGLVRRGRPGLSTAMLGTSLIARSLAHGRRAHAYGR